MKRLVFICILILSVTSCSKIKSEGIKSATTFLSKKSIKKGAIKSELKISQNKIGKTIVKELSDKQAAKTVLQLQQQYGRLQLSKETIQNLYKWGASNNLTEKELMDVLDEFSNHFSQNMMAEYRTIKNASQTRALTRVERMRLEELEKSIVGKDTRLSALEIDKQIDILGSIEYPSSEIVTPKRFAHVAVRHMQNSTKESVFNESFRKRVFPEIESIWGDVNAKSAIQSSTGRVVKTRHYDLPIGTSNQDNQLYDLVVVYEKDGKLVTSFPVDKQYLEKQGFTN
ncbi:MAG: hypothetical protein MJZ16_00540 [Bacteroidales bacterium]|nr:hypothetical protein [Bacteroidales bacterium]